MGAVNTGITFTATDVITSTKMNDIIDQTIMTSDAIIGSTLQVVAPGKLQVAAGGITSTQLANNAVTTVAITDANVTPAKLANADFGDFTVASGVATLDNDAVTTVKILDDNVTTVKIADDAITTLKILDANVTTAKIANANITATKLNGAQTGSAPIFGARAWVNFNGSVNPVTINSSSSNVSSITILGTGHYRVNFTIDMPNVNYAVIGTTNTLSSSVPVVVVAITNNTSNVIIKTIKSGFTTEINCSKIFLTIFG